MRRQLAADSIVEEQPAPEVDENLRVKLQERILGGDADCLWQPYFVLATGPLFESADNLLIELWTYTFGLANRVLRQLSVRVMSVLALVRDRYHCAALARIV